MLTHTHILPISAVLYPHLREWAMPVLLSGLLLIPLAAMAGHVDWDSLNLNSQQESQISRLEDSWAQTHAEVSAQIQQDMAELKSILPTGDTARIRQLQSRITKNKMYLMDRSMDTFLKKRNALNPAQRQKLQKMLPVGPASH